MFFFIFFFNDTPTTEIYTLSLHDALPISLASEGFQVPKQLRTDHRLARVNKEDRLLVDVEIVLPIRQRRSEEHTSELQSHSDLVCRLLLEKKKKKKK